MRERGGPRRRLKEGWLEKNIVETGKIIMNRAAYPGNRTRRRIGRDVILTSYVFFFGKHIL